MQTLFEKINVTATYPRTYRLTRFMILRMIGLIYAVAFIVLINEVLPLIGSDGLLPVSIYLQQIKNAIGVTNGFVHLPSIFWLNDSDTMLIVCAWIGLILSIIIVMGYANAIMMVVVWFLYMSFVHVGQDWYSYGWEIQMNETGFLAIFLCPLLDMRPFPKRPPPTIIIILFRWLIFRIMLGSALIKLRGDEIWRNGTALYYHFETQPIPGPLSRWFHFLPHSILKIGVWFNFLAELVSPFFVFWPRVARHIAGVIIILFQLTIIASGNLSFLNWLTIIPALACFDDGFWQKVLPRKLLDKANAPNVNESVSKPMMTTAWVVAIVVAFLSVAPVVNLVSSNQIMNTSFDPLDLVNTYGAFGTVGRERYNVVFEGTSSDNPTDSAEWKEYIYRGLPVKLDKMPPQVAPYQLHLDWQMWFAAMSTPDQYTWTFNLIWKLLHNDKNAVSLFKENPFKDKPPKYIRAVLYQYSFAKPGNPEKNYWTRKKLGLWILPLSANDQRLIDFLKGQGWVK